MAEIKFIYFTNVGISENFTTNFFDISVHQLTGEEELTSNKKDAAIECINEKELFYQIIQEFARENMDEKNIHSFLQNLEQMLFRNTYYYIVRAGITIMSLEDNSNTIIRSLRFGKF